ncbi:monocarboxylate transporter 4-like isoform X2 [Octopus bimaculoides]|uniref:monocarboxylate transporter 4-like isoform X2 n=1 Tax=Octopus bimaculoides TaxID=37653 RepID=UPI0022E47686|nr:monocarboxylate transporter 4-like isoform X2 [Octopus bimaculoides]
MVSKYHTNEIFEKPSPSNVICISLQKQTEPGNAIHHSSENISKCNDIPPNNYIKNLTSIRSIIVICSAFFIIYNATGFPYSLGVMYEPWMHDYQVGRREITWILSLCIGVISVAGTVVGVFINKIGLRATLLLGSLLSSLGTLLSTFTYTTPYLAASLGIVTGFGSSLNYVSALVAVSQIFPANIKMALTISTIGFPVGIMTFPILITLSVDTYGWRGAFWLMSAVLLNSCVFTLLITPLDANMNNKTSCKLSAEKNVWFHLSIFRDKTFVFYTISLIFISGCISTIIYVLPAVMETRNYNKILAVTILTVESSADIVGRLVCSQVIRVHFITSMLLYIVNSVLFSATMILIPILHGYMMLLIGTLLLGFFSGLVLSIHSVVVLDIIGGKKCSSAIGFGETACGAGNLFIGLIAGYIVEMSHTFDYFFKIMGITSIIVMAVLIIQINFNTIRKCFHLNSKR